MSHRNLVNKNALQLSPCRFDKPDNAYLKLLSIPSNNHAAFHINFGVAPPIALHACERLNGGLGKIDSSHCGKIDTQ